MSNNFTEQNRPQLLMLLSQKAGLITVLLGIFLIYCKSKTSNRVK